MKLFSTAFLRQLPVKADQFRHIGTPADFRSIKLISRLQGSLYSVLIMAPESITIPNGILNFQPPAFLSASADIDLSFLQFARYSTPKFRKFPTPCGELNCLKERLKGLVRRPGIKVLYWRKI